MSNKKQLEAQAIERSRGYTTDESRTGPRDNAGGWRSDLDEELRRFFSGDYVGEAGLGSKLGTMLDKVRDGVAYGDGGGPMTFLAADSHGPAIWCRSDMPARCVEFGRSGLGVNRVMNALRGMQATAARVAVEDGKDIDVAVAKANRQIVVLDAFYRPTPPGALWGLLGLGAQAMVVTMTKPVVDAARGWLAEQRDSELDRYRSALTKSREEAEARLGQWDTWRTELGRKLDDVARELATHADETGAVKRISIARRGWLLRRQGNLPDVDAEISAYLAKVRGEQIPAIDTERMIRRKWDRAPTQDELKDALRRICETAKRPKQPELQAAAERTKNEAELAARRELAAARAAYAAERGSWRHGETGKKKAPGALSRKRQAVIDDFEEQSGLR